MLLSISAGDTRENTWYGLALVAGTSEIHRITRCQKVDGMETMELNGNAKQRRMAGWVANLMWQQGLSFALDADIELGRDELVDYFVSQRVVRDPGKAAELLEDAMAVNSDLFGRRDDSDSITYWVSKRRLVEFQHKPSRNGVPEAESQPEESAPAKKVTRSKKKPRAKKPAKTTAPADESTGEEPITQQYQLAVLQALHYLGGSGKAAIVVGMVPTLMELPKDHQGTYARGPAGKSEEPKYIKFVHSARRFLIKQGELRSPQRGIWAITAKGTKRLKKAGVIS